MNRKFLAIILLFVTAFFLNACSSPELERAQSRSKVSINARFLTESPEEINYPVKVLFAIDCSNSMGDELDDGTYAGSDPTFERITAARDVIDEYNTNINTSFAVVLWHGSISRSTGGFTKVEEDLDAILTDVVNDSYTDYFGALDEIENVIQRDINNSSENARVRTKYIVLFMSDGLPDTGVPIDHDDVLDRVSEITENINNEDVGGFNFNTCFLSYNFDRPSVPYTWAVNLLDNMASLGQGEMTEFETAEAINFLTIIDTRLVAEYEIKYSFAYNYNVRAGYELVYVDSDGDGLTDDQELNPQANGFSFPPTDPTSWDTDNDGISDYLEVKKSAPGFELDPTVPDSDCSPGIIGVDSDGDGLMDCEERLELTRRNFPDDDMDFVPDGIESLNGTSPIQPIGGDMDMDGLDDIYEIRDHTNVKADDDIVRARYSYQYRLRDMGLVAINQGDLGQSYQREFELNISNIDVMNTRARVSPTGQVFNEGDNLIKVFIAQVPQDDSDAEPIFRVAKLVVNIDEPNKNFTLTPSDFELMP